MCNLRSNKGFSLLQSLIVVSVILILSIFIVEAFLRTMAITKRAKCVNNLKQIYQTLLVYLEENHDKMPEARGIDESGSTLPYLKDVLAPYAGDISIFYCPGDPRDESAKQTTGSYDWNFSYFRGKSFSQVEDKAKIILAGDLRSTWHWYGTHFLDKIPEGTPGDEERKINTLFADGHDEYITEKEWQANIKKYKP